MGFENLTELDSKIFLWINHGQRNPFFDRIMPYITEFDHWKVLLLSVWLFFLIVGDKKTKITFLLLPVLVGILDYSNSFFFKPLFARPRPCNVLPNVHVFWPCPRSLSFPSNHAANIFGAAFFLSYIYRNWSPFLILMALVVGYSRVYVGEHYPFDVLGGFILGASGAVLFLLVRNLILSFGRKKE
jgi:undecaprenyl-diphosphatase